MSQNQNKPHLQQQLEQHHIQQQHQQQQHLHQQQLLHHHHQQQQHQQRQWHQQYQQQQHLHHQQQQHQQHAQYAAAAAAHAHVASVAATASSMRVGSGMSGIYGNSLARGGIGGGGCLYDTNRSMMPGGGGSVGVGYDLDMAAHHVGSRSSTITSASTTPHVGGVGGVGYMPPHVNINSVGSGIYNAGMPGMPSAAASESGRRAGAGMCGLYASPQSSAQQQHQQQRLQQQNILPPVEIKMEPLEQIHTPTIEMDELIIKTEPSDDVYNKVSIGDGAIAKGSTPNLHPNAGYMNFPKHLQPYPQQQQQQQQLQQKQQLQHQQHLRHQQQEHQQQQLRRQQQEQHQQQLRQQQQQLRQQQQEQQRVRQQQQQELQQLQLRQQQQEQQHHQQLRQQQQQEQQHQQQLRQQQQQEQQHQQQLRQQQQQEQQHQQQLRQQYQHEQEHKQQLLRKQQQREEEMQQQKQQEQQQLRQQQQQQEEQQKQKEQEQQQQLRQRQEQEKKQKEQEQQQLREQQQQQEVELQKHNQQKEQQDKEKEQKQQQLQQQEKDLQNQQAQEQKQSRPQQGQDQQDGAQLQKEQQQQQRQERERQLQKEQTQPQQLNQEDQQQQQQDQQMLSHDAIAEAGLLTVKLEPQIHIKEEIMDTSQNKPLNFPRRKVQTERSDTPPICQRCKQVFFKKQSYTKHVSQSLCEIVEYDFKCSICPMSFTSSEELQEHEQLHRENMYFCHKYCGKYFDTIELCEVHEYMHHEYVNYICNICSAGFASRDQLFNHMPQHRNQARYDCPICRLWFHTSIQLHQHRLSAPYFCGKFYKPEGAPTAPASSAYDRTPPSSHATNYNLQDCSMGVIEMPGSNNNSFSSILQNRAFHHQQQQQQQQQHSPYPSLQHQQYQQQHLQRQQQHMRFQTPPQHPHRLPPSPQRRLPPLGQPDFMRRSNIGGASNDFHMPQIKTEVKIEPDTYPEFPQQTPLPPPPLPPPPLSSHQSVLNSPSRQRQRFADYSNESFGGGGDSSLSFGSNSNSNDFLNGNSMQQRNSNQFSPNSHFPTTPSCSPHARAADPDESAVCCVPHCGVNKQASPTLQFFTFPKDDKYLHQWLHNLKMLPAPNNDYSPYRICSLHFPKRCINRYSLCYWAVPTFNLGHDDVANLYQNREITNTFTVGERAQCSMPGCPSQRGESNCKFYNFPNDMKTRIKWCQNARLPVHSKEPRHFCSRHFEERCFGKFRLKPWAVPTLHLGTPYGRIHDNPGVFYLEEKKCCLPHCKRTRSSDFNLSLYRFPRDEILLRRWCYNLRLDPAVYRGKNHKICSAHFIKEALGLRKLSPGAVPTLNLGHNDRFNIYENELPTPPPPAAVPAPKMFNFHNVSTPPAPYNSQHQRHSMGSGGSSHSGRMYANPVSGLKFSISNITAGDMSSMSNTSTQNILDSIDVCFVPNCKRNRNIDNVTLHTIPRRPDQMRKWCHNLKIRIDSLHKGVRICSAHFEPYCIGGCMRPFAVPTLNLGHDDPNIYRNPDVIKKLNIRETCCVQDCRRNRDRDRANLHRFPSNLTMLTKWCENLLKPVPDGTKLFNDAICERHFDERCIRSKRLEKWAVPTVMLGHNEEPKHALPTDEEIAELWPKPLPPNRGGEDGECCVRTCRRDPKVDDIKLYRTPEEPEVLAKWAHNLQVETEDLTTLRICNLHFEEHCFSKKRRLQDWALPTLNLAANVEQLYENPEPLVPLAIRKAEERRERRRMQRDANEPAKPWKPRCCLPHCRKRRGTDLVQLFRFPVLNRAMLAKWCHNLQLPLVSNAHRRICSSHFEERVLSKRCPVPLAVPTIDLNTPPGYKIYTNPARLSAVKLGLQQTCCISSCNRNRSDGVQLFRYPHSRSLLRKWCHNTRKQTREAIRGQYRVCSRHFEPHSFGAKRLMPRAIPTLNLDAEVEEPFANEAQSFAETQCVVSGCVATKELDGVRLFKFPYDDEDLLWKWCNNLKLNPIDCRGVRICNRHFEDECVGPKNIYKWAIPTLALGHNDPDIKVVPVPPPEERYNDAVTKCCVPTCGKSRKFDDAQMNSFPKELRLFRAWKHNLKLDYLDFKDRDKFKICSEHFEPVCLGKGRLNHGAIPTLNLGHDDTDDLYTVDPAQLQVSLFGKMRPCVAGESATTADAVDAAPEKADIIKCAYPNCTATKALLREPYDMPAALPLHALWCAQMKVDTEALSETPKLCGLHFIKLYKSTADAANALAEGDAELSDALKSLAETYDKCCASPTVCSAQCCVVGCSSNQISVSRTAQRLYLFPAAASSGAELNEKWCQNVGVTAADLSRYQHRVCARHFDPICIGPTQRLRAWAVPTLQLKHKKESEIQPIPELGSAVRPHEARCCVPACARERGDFETMRLFSFPLVEEVLEKWLHNLQLTRNECARLRICDQHFETRCIMKGRLLRWAVPTLLLERKAEELLQNEPPVQPATQRVKEKVVAADKNVNKVANDALDAEGDEGSGELTVVPNVKIKKALDVVKCCVENCQRSRIKHGVRLFPFPTSQQMLKKWLHNLKMPTEIAPSASLRICSLHFHKRCIEGKELRPWAKPTNALGHTGPIFENNKNLPGVFLPKCCLPHCRERRTLENHLRTFGFPKDPVLMEKWCSNLRMRPRLLHARICMTHFEPAAMGNKKLRANAVPTLNLGHDEPLKYDNKVLIASAPPRAAKSNPLDETKATTSDAGKDEQEKDDEDEEEDEEEEVEQDDENDLHATADLVNSDEEETVEDFTPSISAATGDDDESHNNALARKIRRPNANSDDEDEEQDEVYGNGEEEEDEDNSDESAEEHVYDDDQEDDDDESESEEEVINDESKDVHDDDDDDEDIEMLIDDEDDKNTDCDPLDFLECGNEEEPKKGKKSAGKKLAANKKALKRPVSTTPVHYDYDESNTMYSNVDDSTRFTTATTNSATATTSCASASAASASLSNDARRYGREKISRSVFRLSCLKHRRKKKAPPDPQPPDKQQSAYKDKRAATTKQLMNKSLPCLQQKRRMKCAVHCCARAGGPSLPLYSFPPLGTRYCRYWCAQLNVKMLQTPRLRICQRHFAHSLIDRRRRNLRFGAIPTRNLYSNTASAHARSTSNLVAEAANQLNETTQFKESPPFKLKTSTDLSQPSHAQLNPYLRCCVPHCGKTHRDDGVTLFSFPKLRSLFLQWTANLRLKPTARLVQVYKVCSEHFEQSCLSVHRSRTTLQYGSVPTLKLGHAEDLSNLSTHKSKSAGRKRRIKIGPMPKRKSTKADKPVSPQKSVKECAVHDCRVAHFLQMQLFPLPDVQKLQERWSNYFKLNISSSNASAGNAAKFFQNVRLCALHYMEGYQMATDNSAVIAKGASAALEELEANYARITSSTRIQVLKCCVPNCSTKFTDNVRLTAFPGPAELRAKWQHNTQVTFSPSHRYLYKVCALHFQDHCFGKKRLRQWAVPTLNLPPPRNKDPKHRIYENPTIDEVGTSYCCVEGCTTTEDGSKKESAMPEAVGGERAGVATAARLWHFPLDEGLREKWCHNLGLNAEAQKITHTSRRWRICGRHFEDYCFGKALRTWAVPTLHLPKPSKLTKSGKRSTYIYQNPDSAIHFYRCCIKTCGQQRDIDAGIRLYAFPKKDTMLQKWAHNVRMSASKCRHARICTLHFEAQCMRPQMQHWALPTIALGHDEADIFRNPKVKLKVTNGRCCLPHCNKCRSTDNVRLFAFPRDEQVLSKWWHNLGIAAQESKLRLICETHFEPRCISLRRLQRWAVPTLNLGHTNETLENPTPTEVLAFENNRKSTTRRSQTPSKLARTPKPPRATTPAAASTVKCAITACARGSDAGAAFYRFPKPDWLRKKWCDNTRLDEEAAKTAKVCARHFETQVMGNHKPRPWALPTLELGTDAAGAPLSPVHANPKQLSRFHPEEHEWGELRYVRANHCSIISCMKSKSDGVILFNYPTNPHMLKKWAENCRHYAYQAKRYRFQLCGTHFTDDCFKREGTRLRKGAVPTLNLGHDDEHIHQSKFENVVLKSRVEKCCSVPQCGRTTEHEGIRLFRFPSERPEILEKWCHNVRLNPDDCRQAMICNMHFEARCVGPMRLLQRAIPTLLLGHNDLDDIYENPESFDAPEKVVSCCVPGCNNTKTTEGVVLSSFPKLRTQFDKWAHNLRLPTNATVWHTYKVCSAHFESYCYEHGRIRVGALPTLNLGHDDTADLYTVNEETMTYSRKRKLLAPKIDLPKVPQQTCCYPECREVDLRLSHSLYELPAADVIRQTWLKAMGLCAEEEEKEEELKRAQEIKAEYLDIKAETVNASENVGASSNEIDKAVKCEASIVAKTDDGGAEPKTTEETTRKICPVHFKILYMEHEALLQDLQSENQPEITRCLQDLEKTFKIVSDLSCVRRICCAVSTCSSNSLTTPNIRYNKFPDHPEMRAKWCHNTQVTVDTDRLYCYKVCELHFEPDCASQLSKKMQRLKSWAIPTLNLPPRTDDMPDIYPLPDPDTVPETRRAALLMQAAVQKCYIPSCVYAKPPEERGEEANDSDVQFFNFPNHAELLYKWVFNTEISMVAAAHARICSLHFEKHCINKRLRMYAVPTLNLGHCRTDIYHNPANKRVAAVEEDKGEEMLDDDADIKDEKDEKEEKRDEMKLEQQEATVRGVKKEKRLVKKPKRVLSQSSAALRLRRKRELARKKAAEAKETVAPSAVEHDEDAKGKDTVAPPAVEHETDAKEQETVEVSAVELKVDTKASLTGKVGKKRRLIKSEKVKKAKKHIVELEEDIPKAPLTGKMRKKRKLAIKKRAAKRRKEQVAPAADELKEETKVEAKVSKKQATAETPTLKEKPKVEKKVSKKLAAKLEDDTQKTKTENAYPKEEPKLDTKVCKKPAAKLEKHKAETTYHHQEQAKVESKESKKHQAVKHAETTQKPTTEKPYHKPFILNVKEEIDDAAETEAEEEAQEDGDEMQATTIELQMKEGLLDTFHGFAENADDEQEQEDDAEAEPGGSAIAKTTITARHCRISGCNAYLREPGVTLFKFPCALDQFRKWLHNTQLDVDYTRRWRYRICNRHFEPICTEFCKLPVGSMPTLNLGPMRPAKIYENEFNAAILKKKKQKLRFDRKTDHALVATTTALDFEETETNSSFLAEALRPEVTVGEQPHEDCDDNEDYGMEANQDYTLEDTENHASQANDDYEMALTPLERDTSRHCRIPDCSSHAKDPNVTLFKFPLSEYLFRKWLHNTQLKVDYTRRWRYRICQRHFDPICMQFRKLPPGTMPTLNLGPSRPARIYENSFDVNHLRKFKPKPPTTSATATATATSTANTISSSINPPTPLYNEEAETRSSFEHASNEMPQLPTYANNEALPTSTQLMCSIRNCTSIYQRGEGVHLHKLPANVTLREKWLHNCRLSKDKLASIGSRMRVCTLHFTTNCFFGQKRQLKFGAIPTLRLGHTESNIYADGFSNAGEAGQHAIAQSAAGEAAQHAIAQSAAGEAAQHAIAQSAAGGPRHDICCLSNCTRSAREYTRHFAFPTERKILDQWLHALGKEFNSSPPDDSKICEWHFKSSDFDGEVLLADAVPTRYLKADDSNQSEDEGDGHYDDDEDDELVWNRNEEPLDERPSTSAAAAAAAAITPPDDGKKLIPGARKCCLSHCRKQIFPDNVRTFKFPAMRNQFQKWIHNLGVDYDGDSPWRYQICSEHFEEKCLIQYENKSKLFRWAVPTLKLGKNAPAILFTNDGPNKTKTTLRTQDFDRDNYRNISDDDMDMDATNDASSSALPGEMTNSMAYQRENEMGLLAPIAPIERAAQQKQQSAPKHTNSYATPQRNVGTAANNAYNVADVDDYDDDDDDEYDDAYDVDNENSLLDIIREDKPQPVKEGTPASAFYTHQLLRGRTPKERACCLPHCGRTRSTGVRLFRFPTEPIFLQRWEYNLRVRFNGAQRNTHLICSLHFERSQYNKRLVIDAIPTLDLGHNSADIYRSGQTEPPVGAPSVPPSLSPFAPIVQQSLSMKPLTPIAQQTSSNNAALAATGNSQIFPKTLKCNVPACMQTKRRLFPFPSNMGFVKIWSERTQIAYDARQHAELRVCDLHFEVDCFSAQGLNNNAVPTLYLPAPTLYPAATALTTATPTTKTLVPLNRPMLSTAAAAAATVQTPPPVNPTKSTPMPPTQMPKLSAIACSVSNCGNNTATRPDLKIFSKFPDDFELFTKWCFNLKIDPRTYVNGAYNVCSEHFESFCIGGHSLRVWAVPTLRLGHNSKLIHSVERPAEVEMKCCLPHCGRNKSKDGVEFYNFPKGEIYRQWCQILRIDEGLYRNTDKKICSAHFRADCFNSNGTLRQGARPTLLLLNRTPTAAAHILKPPAPYRSKCIVRTCHEMQQLYSFPAQRILCNKWCHNLKIDYYPKLHENMNFKICRRHFEPNCLLSGGKLHVEAVPTVQLGHNDVNIYQNIIGMKNTANTPSYDDNSSLRTSVSTVHTWLMDVDAETNAHMPAPSTSLVGAGPTGVRRMQYEPPVELEPIAVDADDDDLDDDDVDAVGVVNDSMDLSNNTYMPLEDDSYGGHFGEPRLLPQSSTFIAAESTEIIDLDDVDAVQEQFPNWTQDDAVLVDDDDDDDDVVANDMNWIN